MSTSADNHPRHAQASDLRTAPMPDALPWPDADLAPALLAALTAGAMPVAIKCSRLRYRYANPAYSALLGMTSTDLVGQCDEDMLSVACAAQAQHQDTKALLCAGAVTEELALQVEGCDPVPVRLTRQALYQGTQAVGLLCWAATSSPAIDSWEVRERRLMLHLAKVAHELRTPLAGMVGMMRLTLDGHGLLQDHRRNLMLIEQCCQHLVGMANDLVDFGRASSGILTLHPQVVDLACFVDGVEEWLVPRAKGQGLSLHAKAIVTPQRVSLPVAVRMDQMRVRQILFNLLSNALRHTRWGSIRLDTQLSLAGGSENPADARPARLRFDVRDTGEGMSAQQVADLFNFSRVLQSWGEPRGSVGAGLGLPICRRLVRAMGGEMHVSSQPGVGSTVWFEIDVELVS